MTRTDRHAPSNIVPSEYSYQLSYSGSFQRDGEEIPGFGINHMNDYIESHPMADIHEGSWRCDICGAHFIHGDIWLHEASGESITTGQDCADKMSMSADRSEWVGAKMTAINPAKREALAIRAGRFTRKHDGLAEALETDHGIIVDIKARLLQYGELSPKQVALVFKIANEKVEREANQLPSMPAPEGRQVIEGTVVSIKGQDNPYSYNEMIWKMLVVVEQDGAEWRTWGTVPAAIDGVERGARVRFTATVTRADDDEAFSFYKRPTKAEILSPRP